MEAWMAGYAHSLSRTVLMLFVWLWAWVMVVCGVLAMTEWSERIPALVQIRYPVFAGGAIAAAFGVFIFALSASRWLPRAHAWVTGLFMTAPWLALAVVLIGGLA
jgi:hypothetical protein